MKTPWSVRIPGSLTMRDSDDPRFMWYVYRFDWLENLCLVSMVVVLVVPCLFGCVVSTIHTVPHYIPFCMYHFPKRHMVYDHLKSLFLRVLTGPPPSR